MGIAPSRREKQAAGPQPQAAPPGDGPFHAIGRSDAVRALDSDVERGLEPSEARARLARLGPNRIPAPAPDPFAARLFGKLKEPMSLLLIGAAAIAGIGLGEGLDAAVILVIVAANAAIALAQEGKAARSLEALKSLESPAARVVRGGRVEVIPADALVAGDIVLLATGDRVPADLRLLETASMEVDESLLTGESLPVQKDARVPSDLDAALADRSSMAFSATIVSRGVGRGVVVATGPATELGMIAESLRERQPPTPLQVELAHLTGRLGIAAVAIALVVFVLTLISVGTTTEGLQRSLLSAVALAVAAVPEGLASVVTVALALGVRRMARAGAIIRLLPAVETLGSTDIILTDKTGTLTENRMRVEAIAVPGRPAVTPTEVSAAELRPILEVAALCNDSSLDPPVGDPLEIALLEMSGSALTQELSERLPRMGEAPFDSERKRMSTLHASGEGPVLLVKGAPETVIDLCRDAVIGDGSRAELEDESRARLSEQVNGMADKGMRVLALARRRLDEAPEDVEAAEHDLTLVGLVGLRDPVRRAAAAAVREAQRAGMSLIMVTGDHPSTAAAIAEEVGILRPGHSLVTGSDLRTTGIPTDPTGARVYARVDPDDKLALVQELRKGGRVVAVTGDGVNDAPALRRADIGVAMGRSGTDAAREAADMVITDDDLSTIVTAVREGRGIYDNIRKVVDYLVAANLSEIVVVVSCLLLFPELGVPLLPIQLLWINLLTDGLPALALGVDPIDPAVMNRPPRPRSERLLTRARIMRLLGRGVVIATACVASLVVVRFGWSETWPRARAVMFTVLAVSQLLYAFAVHVPHQRTGTRSITRLLTNRWLLAGVGAGFALQLAIVLFEPAHEVFGTSRLHAREWGLVALASVAPAIVIAALDRLRLSRESRR